MVEFLLPSPERGKATALAILQPSPELAATRSGYWQCQDGVGSEAVLSEGHSRDGQALQMQDGSSGPQLAVKHGDTARNPEEWAPPMSSIIFKIHSIYNN